MSQKEHANDFDVVGFGALNMDQLHMVDQLAGPDDESFITGFTEACGGSAANTIIGVSRLGLKTGFIGKVAADREGKILLDNLNHENVNTDGVMVTAQGRSGRVMGFVDKEGQRSLYVDAGVNDTISIDEMDLSYLINTQILHLTSFVGDSFQAQQDLISEIHDKIKISFDPGRLYVEKGWDDLKIILNRTDILLINEIELKLLLGSKFISYSQGAKLLLDNGITTVVVKRGDKGSYAINNEFEVAFPCFETRCIDTTGAGDAFNAGFLYAFLKGYDLEESSKLGNFVASKCVECGGAIGGLPHLSEMGKLEKYEKS